MNRYPEENIFTYEFIVPEDEVVSYEEEAQSAADDACSCVVLTERPREDRVSLLLEAAKEIWQFPYVRAIQTGVECDSASAGLTELERGGLPNMHPSAVVEEVCGNAAEYLVMPVEGRRGILLRSRIQHSGLFV